MWPFKKKKPLVPMSEVIQLCKEYVTITKKLDLLKNQNLDNDLGKTLGSDDRHVFVIDGIMYGFQRHNVVGGWCIENEYYKIEFDKFDDYTGDLPDSIKPDSELHKKILGYIELHKIEQECEDTKQKLHNMMMPRIIQDKKENISIIIDKECVITFNIVKFNSLCFTRYLNTSMIISNNLTNINTNQE